MKVGDGNKGQPTHVVEGFNTAHELSYKDTFISGYNKL